MQNLTVQMSLSECSLQISNYQIRMTEYVYLFLFYNAHRSRIEYYVCVFLSTFRKVTTWQVPEKLKTLM